MLKNNTNAIFQKTIAQKQTNRNSSIIDYCHRCSLASSQVRCSDVGEVHNRCMQLWLLSEWHYEYECKVNSILMLNKIIPKLFPELSLQQLTSINILDFVYTALHTPFSFANSAAAFVWSLTTSTLSLAHFRSAYSSNAVRTPTTITILPAFATNRHTIAR